MALNFNGVNIPNEGTFNFNGVPLEAVFFNGVLVWEAISNHVMVAGQNIFPVGPNTVTGYQEGSIGTLNPNAFKGIIINSLVDSDFNFIQSILTLKGNHPKSIFTSMQFQGPGVNTTRFSANASFQYIVGVDLSQWVWTGHIGLINGSAYNLAISP